MKKIIIFMLLLAAPLAMFAQSVEKTIIKYSDSGKPKSVSFSKTDRSVAIPKTHNDFFKEFLNITKDDEFIENKRVKLETGHQTFEQYYKGIKVEDAGYTFHYDDDGVMQFVHGKYVEIEDLNPQPSISPEDAKNIFAKYQNIDLDLVTGFSSELLVKCISDGNSKTLPLLIYKVSLDANSTNNDAIGYINAHTGNVEGTISNVCNISSTGTFVTRYHGNKYANTDYYNNTYRLYDNSRGAIIWTRNMNGYVNSTNLSLEITDTDNYWQYTYFNNRLDMGLDVHWALQKIYDRLYNVHGKNSYDNNGVAINAFVNAFFYVDSYYNYTTNNAAWYNSDTIMCFGVGISHPRAFTSMDIIAHEFGHGISYFQIGWSDGAQHLNEGLSDIWGIIMDYRYPESDSETWKIGENVYSSDITDCLRNIASPQDNLASCKIANRYFSNDYNINNDKYYRSGVFSHWFYLLVNGGTYYSNNIPHTFTGVGMDIAENLIVKAVYNSYLRNCDDYPEVRDVLIAAAKSMNIEGLESTVNNAWLAVGVEEIQRSISGPTCPCDISTYTINDLPSSYTIEWAFQDSLSSVASLLSYNTSNSHVCTIDNTSHGYFNEVLEARIFINNHYFTTLTKRIWSGANFIADMVNEFDDPPIIGGQTVNRIWSVHYGDSINIMDSGTITLTSDCFFLASITYPTTGITNWEHDGNEISFHVNTGRWERTLTFSGQNGCDYFEFYIIVPSASGLLSLNYLPELDISSSNTLREITISIGTPSEHTGEDDDDIIDKGYTKPRLVISNVVTGHILYEGEMANNSFTLSTSGWQSGIYAVKAVIGNYILTKKVYVQ